jgi:hypothetical protein
MQWTTTGAAIGVAVGVLMLAQAGCEARPGPPAQAAASDLPGSMPTREARTGLPPDSQQQAAEATIRPAVQPASSLGRVNPDPSALPIAKPRAAETPSSTAQATGRATPQPTGDPTPQPTGGATAQPANSPTAPPTNSPTAQASSSPTPQPSPSPKPSPTTVASATAQPQPTSVAAGRVPTPNQPGAWLGLFSRKP